MTFIYGLIVGGIISPFIVILAKKGYNIVKDWASK